MALAPINLADIQFSGSDQEKLRRLVEELRKTQQALNSAIQLVNQLEARISVLEAASP